MAAGALRAAGAQTTIVTLAVVQFTDLPDRRKRAAPDGSSLRLLAIYCGFTPAAFNLRLLANYCGFTPPAFKS